MHKLLTKPKGLPNIALTCYLNSLLQALCATSAVDTIASLAEKNKNSPTAHALTAFFNAYFATTTDVVTESSSKVLYDLLVDRKIIPGGRCLYDAPTAFVNLVAALDDEFVSCQCAIVNPFSFDMTNARQILEPHVLFEGGSRSLMHDFQASFVTRESKVYILPQIFTVSAGSVSTGGSTDAFVFPLELSFKPYLAHGEQTQDTEYALSAIVLYSSGSKHYTAGCSRFANTWYFCNDSLIQPLSSSTMENFSTKGYLTFGDHFIPRMLFYERKSSFKQQTPMNSLYNLSNQLDAFSALVQKS